MILEWFILFFAGVLGGILNSVAGGGSFITFPALLFAGVPPIAANATNTFASCAGYLSGAYAFRKEISTEKKNLKKIIIPSFVGGLLGAMLLLNTPESVFTETIPWLLLFATLLFIFGGKLNQLLVKLGGKHKHANAIGSILLALLLLLICIYGGFFNAGLG
ncbi:MAG: sulfite exporter TauE/SafE family protein, partial [Psychromonas sp.]